MRITATYETPLRSQFDGCFLRDTLRLWLRIPPPSAPAGSIRRDRGEKIALGLIAAASGAVVGVVAAFITFSFIFRGNDLAWAFLFLSFGSG